jgi:hypothetical protein
LKTPRAVGEVVLAAAREADPPPPPTPPHKGEGSTLRQAARESHDDRV